MSQYLAGNYPEFSRSDLETDFEKFCDQLSKIIVFICIILVIINFENFAYYGGTFEGFIYYLKYAIPLAIIPWGLYLLFSRLHSICANQISLKGAFMKQGLIIEDLANTTVVCLDLEDFILSDQVTVKEVVLFDDTVDKINNYNIDQKETTDNNAVNVLHLFHFISNIGRNSLNIKATLNKFIQDFELIPKEKDIPSLIGKDFNFFGYSPRNTIRTVQSVMLRDGSVVPLNSEHKAKLMDIVDNLNRKGLNPIAVRDEERKVFLGFIGLQEYVRPEVFFLRFSF